MWKVKSCGFAVDNAKQLALKVLRLIAAIRQRRRMGTGTRAAPKRKDMKSISRVYNQTKTLGHMNNPAAEYTKDQRRRTVCVSS